MTDKTVHALKGIDFQVESGEFVAIIGKSGSGKTTAVNQIGCLDTPTSGRIILDGQDVSKLSESNLAKIRGKKIGYIFQKFNLIKNLTALENVMLPMMFQGISIDNRELRAKRLLSDFDMKERFNFKPSEISGGQQQRVAIARALANSPEIILADEPTGNLDSKTGEQVFRYLEELNKNGKTIILVTHDDSLAKRAKRILTLIDGKIVDDKINK
jgi:putative ABC transport system ATP-binding protein